MVEGSPSTMSLDAAIDALLDEQEFDQVDYGEPPGRSALEVIAELEAFLRENEEFLDLRAHSEIALDNLLASGESIPGLGSLSRIWQRADKYLDRAADEFARLRIAIEQLRR